jgi:hypothetical protein
MNLLIALQEDIHYSFIKLCIYGFSLWYDFCVHYALWAEKLSTRSWWGPLEFQFLRLRGSLTNSFGTLSLCFRVIRKTPGLIPDKYFVKKIFSASAIAIMSWQAVTRSSLCSAVKDCGTQRAHNFLFPKSSIRIRSTAVLGMFKESALSYLMRFHSYFDRMSISSNVYRSSSRFWMATSLVIFYQLPSVSKSRISPENLWSVDSLVPTSLLHQY